jgi:hypothetical protein
MIGTNLPGILYGFIPTILNPTLEYGDFDDPRTAAEKASDYLKSLAFSKANIVEFSLYLLYVVLTLNVIVFVLCVRQAIRQGKPLAGIAGLLPVYNVIWLASQTRVSPWFIIVYSILHTLLMFFFAYNLKMLGMF